MTQKSKNSLKAYDDNFSRACVACKELIDLSNYNSVGTRSKNAMHLGKKFLAAIYFFF